MAPAAGRGSHRPTAAGGAQHERFWHGLDRFYYQVYQPWRLERRKAVEELAQRVTLVLGAGALHAGPQDLSWLPPENPLRCHPALRLAAVEGPLRVFFWVEPFGLSDAFVLAPGVLTVACAESGELSRCFCGLAGGLAQRAAALGDPTRLLILRLIHRHGLTNTEIARRLGLARPTVCEHVRILRAAGLIRSRRVGRQTRHELVPGFLPQLFGSVARFLDLPAGEQR